MDADLHTGSERQAELGEHFSRLADRTAAVAAALVPIGRTPDDGQREARAECAYDEIVHGIGVLDDQQLRLGRGVCCGNCDVSHSQSSHL